MQVVVRLEGLVKHLEEAACAHLREVGQIALFALRVLTRVRPLLVQQGLALLRLSYWSSELTLRALRHIQRPEEVGVTCSC